MGDAAACANAGQRLPKGCYNMVMMLQMVSRRGGEFRWCRLDICMDVADDGKSVNPKRHKGSQRRPRLESNLKVWLGVCVGSATGLSGTRLTQEIVGVCLSRGPGRTFAS